MTDIADRFGMPVAALAADPVARIAPDATLYEVATEMMEHYVRHVLIEENGRLVGIVSARDLLGAYAAADASDTADDVED